MPPGAPAPGGTALPGACGAAVSDDALADDAVPGTALPGGVGHRGRSVQAAPILASRSTMRLCTSSLVDRSARNSTVSPEASRGNSFGSSPAEV